MKHQDIISNLTDFLELGFCQYNLNFSWQINSVKYDNITFLLSTGESNHNEVLLNVSSDNIIKVYNNECGEFGQVELQDYSMVNFWIALLKG